MTRTLTPPETPHTAPSPVASAQTADLRVAQIIGTFGGGGAERLAYNLACALHDQGVSSAAIALRQRGTFSEDGAVETLSLDIRSESPIELLRAVRRLRRCLAERGINVVHVHGSNALPLVALAVRRMRPRPMLLFTWHDSQRVLDGRSWRDRLVRWALRRCDRVFGSSSDVADRLHRACGRPVEVFRNGVPELPALGEPDANVPTIIWAARLAPLKDPQILLRAAARLRDEGLDFRIVLAGDAADNLRWFADQTRELIHEHGLEDRVSMPGWVDDCTTLYRGAAIGVQTSHSEGLSMTLLEQMMAGLAVVATDVGDTAAAVADGRTGLLIPPTDEDALTDALRRLLTDPALRQRLAAAAREQALAVFSLPAMAKQAIAVYDASSG